MLKGESSEKAVSMTGEDLSRIKTAPTKRKNWQINDFALKTEDGQLHIGTPGSSGYGKITRHRVEKYHVTTVLIAILFI